MNPMPPSLARDRRSTVYLEHIDTARHMARFYCIRIQKTLFGEWAVVFQWGRIGASGQSREQWLETWPEACEARDRQRDRKIRRGYTARSLDRLIG